jgi:hypothetical protein
MSESELDDVYTRLCTTLTPLGEAHAALYLARLALLALVRLDDAVVAQELIDAAARDLHRDAARAS